MTSGNLSWAITELLPLIYLQEMLIMPLAWTDTQKILPDGRLLWSTKESSMEFTNNLLGHSIVSNFVSEMMVLCLCIDFSKISCKKCAFEVHDDRDDSVALTCIYARVCFPPTGNWSFETVIVCRCGHHKLVHPSGTKADFFSSQYMWSICEWNALVYIEVFDWRLAFHEYIHWQLVSAIKIVKNLETL